MRLLRSSGGTWLLLPGWRRRRRSLFSELVLLLEPRTRPAQPLTSAGSLSPAGASRARRRALTQCCSVLRWTPSSSATWAAGFGLIRRDVVGVPSLYCRCRCLCSGMLPPRFFSAESNVTRRERHPCPIKRYSSASAHARHHGLRADGGARGARGASPPSRTRRARPPTRNRRRRAISWSCTRCRARRRG